MEERHYAAQCPATEEATVLSQGVQSDRDPMPPCPEDFSDGCPPFHSVPMRGPATAVHDFVGTFVFVGCAPV